MKERLAVLIALTLAASTAVGCTGRGGDETPTAEVTRGAIMTTVSVSGNVNAPDDRLLTFGVPGTVETVPFEKGATVRKGDILAQLDTTDLERGIELARAGLQQAEIQYDVADNQLRQTIYPHYYYSYVIDVPGTWMALDNAAEKVQKARGLIEAGKSVEAQLLLEAATEDIGAAQESAQARSWEMPLPVRVMELQREAAAVAVDVALVNLEAAQEALEDATITAPFDGVIAAVHVEEGDILSAMNLGSPAVQVIDPSYLDMTGLIDEMDIADIETGQKAIITLDALPGLEVAGTVTYVSAAATIQAGVVMYGTTITLDNPGSEVKDGMSATADIVLEERSNVLLLPAAAVMKNDAGHDIVYVVGADGKAVARDITTGLRRGGSVEIVSGVVEGDVVALQAPK